MTSLSRLAALTTCAALALMPSAVPAQSTRIAADEVVVTGTRARLSNWREAETAHAIVLSDGPEAELVRMATNLERLHFLLAGLLGPGLPDDDMVKLRITLIGDPDEFDKMNLGAVRWQQGPYSELFQISRYYDPREDGAVMASTRVDQRVVVERTTINPRSVQSVLQSMAAYSSDPNLRAELSAAIGGFNITSGMRGPSDRSLTSGEEDIQMTAESLLYAGYAQHYLLSHFPAAYPRWYLDGFGQIFATFAVRRDGALEFGRTPNGAPAVMQQFGPFPMSKLFDDSYLTANPSSTRWTPIHAWILTHFLFFSDTHRPQLRQYLAARADGVDAVTAAKLFGDQKTLAKEMSGYFYNRKPYLEIKYEGAKIDAPIVRRLRESEAAFVKGRLELGARVVIPPAAPASADADTAKAMNEARDEALRQRGPWLERLRRDANKWPNELGAQLLLAEAECRSGKAKECLAAANRAAAIASTDARVLMWKGTAMVAQAASAPAAERPAMMRAARQQIVRANQIDHEAAGPLLAYYESFAAAGEAPSVAAIDGLQKAMEEVPAAPETRLKLATALVQRGQMVEARPVIMPVAVGAYKTPERDAARALLGRIDTERSTHAAGLPTFPQSDNTIPTP